MLRHALGILLGLALTIGTVVLAFVAVALFAGDALGDPQSETINLDPFLWVELIAGTAGAMIGGAAVLLLVGLFVYLFAFGPRNEPVVISSGGNGGGNGGKKGGGEFVVTAAQTAIVTTLKEAREATQRGDFDSARSKLGIRSCTQ